MGKKLDTRQHVSKVEREDREQTKSILKEKQTELFPASFLDRHEKYMFKALCKQIQDTPLSGIDSYELSLLILQLNYVAQSAQNIRENGLVNDNKKNPAVAIQNTALKNVSSLLNDLGLTYNKRMNSILDKIQNNTGEYDPLVSFLSDDEDD